MNSIVSILFSLILLPFPVLSGTPSVVTDAKHPVKPVPMPGDLPCLVVPPDWNRLNPSSMTGDFEEGVRKMLLTANKFALNAWYADRKGFDRQSGEFLDFGGRIEAHIRPVAHQVFALAVSLKWNVYSPDAAGLPRDEAVRRTVRMVRSLCHHHKANEGKEGWGDAWQSALWASQAALAGWFLWDELDAPGKTELVRMLEHEANRFLAYKVPYYQNKAGKILTPGDSKAEENAWNSTILVAANVMMPRHPNWQAWNDKAIELQVSSYSAPGDWEREESLNGFALNRLNGSNINQDGTVINHNLVHPDYMTAIMGSSTNAWIYSIGGMNAPAGALFNGDRVYRALTDLDVGGGKTMYASQNGLPTSNMYYPQGNDWGYGRQANYWLMDIMADLFHWDGASSIKGRSWAVARQQEMQRMQSRSTTGQYYQSPGEDKFDSREEWISYHLAFAYLGLWLHRNGMVDFTKEPLRISIDQ